MYRDTSMWALLIWDHRDDLERVQAVGSLPAMEALSQAWPDSHEHHATVELVHASVEPKPPEKPTICVCSREPGQGETHSLFCQQANLFGTAKWLRGEA